MRSQLTPAQQADIIARSRDGRPDKAVMTGEERRQRGLMDVQQAAEHVRLATITSPHMADRVRGRDPDDMWTGEAPSRDDEEYAAIWMAWTGAGHLDKGCFGWMRDFEATEVMCSCGDRLPVPQKAATG